MTDIGFIQEIPFKAPPEISQKTIVSRCHFDLSRYDDSLFNEFAIVFPEALKNAVPKRKAEFLAGRYCAGRALQALRCAQHQVGIGENRSPLWPDGVVGAISHDCNNAIVMAKHKTSTTDAIGVDIEKWIAESELDKVQQLVLNQDEHQLLMQSGLSMQQGITTLFSAKESFFKAIYNQVGEYFGFEEAQLIDIVLTPGGGQLKLAISPFLKEHLIQLQPYLIRFCFEPDGVLTICDI
ncbi:4'-phosphopantetheinyl transferase family protein [Planctobacterium marinum]|uniref:Enterobactin synthase component D n=1 Tax=Planctobacterium marinum TaxID=1631968 RepID=A0AA48KN07_9ALTE|nr:4'-phosphopantetheinyl transferase [Planctobacterium marinum]